MAKPFLNRQKFFFFIRPEKVSECEAGRKVEEKEKLSKQKKTQNFDFVLTDWKKTKLKYKRTFCFVKVTQTLLLISQRHCRWAWPP